MEVPVSDEIQRLRAEKQEANKRIEKLYAQIRFKEQQMMKRMAGREAGV